MRFITDYCRLNQQSIRKPHTLPRKDETTQQLVGLQYAAELDLNMGYYTLILSPASQDMITIVTDRGKFRYN